MLKGLIICIVAGVCGALINIALVVGAPIQEAAVDHGRQTRRRPDLRSERHLVHLAVGRLRRQLRVLRLADGAGTARGSSSGPSTAAINWFHTAAMGLMWMGTFAIYGICTAKTGKLGPAIVFPLFIGMAIITGNLWGLLTGEWKGSGSKPLQQMALSVIILILGMGVIGWSNTLS